MRYAKSESTNILALFNSGDTVTIDIYRLSDNTKVVDSTACTEIATTGIFKYEFSQSVSQKEEFLWIMTNGEYSKYGKIVLGGYMDTISNNITEHRNTVEPNIDTAISSRASQESVNAIPTNPLLDNDTRLDNLDAKISTRSSHTPADVWSYTTRELTNPDQYKADVSDLAKESTVQSIKSQTDKLKFNAEDDVVATLDGEKVALTDATESQIDNIESNVIDHDQYKADVSDLAKESTVQSIKSQTDKLQFDSSNNVQAKVNDKGVLNDPSTDEIVDAIWDEPVSTHTSSGSFGKEVQSHATPSEVRAQVDQALADYDPPTKTELDQAEANIRGADNDTLKALSDQIDLVKEQTDKIPTIQLDVSFIKDIEGGRWVLDGHQMVFYKEDNTTEVARFNLYRSDGTLISEGDNVYERRRV